jgi:hypothetical protein
MKRYLELVGGSLIVLGICASAYLGYAAWTNEDYYAKVRALAKYPTHVLYQTEFKMAEPRQMLLVAGAYAAAPVGIVFGSLCLGLAVVISRQQRHS